METKYTNHSKGATFTRFFRVIFRIIYFFLWLAIAFNLILMIVSAFTGTREALPGTLEVLATFNAENTGNLQWSKNFDTEVSMKGGVGLISINQADPWFYFINQVKNVIVLLLVAFSIRHVLKMFNSLKTQSFLIPENALRLRHIGLLNIAAYSTGLVAQIALNSYLEDKITWQGLDFQKITAISFVTFESALWALFLIVIAEIFRLSVKS